MSRPTVEDTKLFANTLELASKERIRSIRSIPLNDATCLELFKCNEDKHCRVQVPSYLHICANPLPCRAGEIQKTTNSRDWCKGRGLQLGSDKFNEAVAAAKQIYEQTERERLERLESLPKKAKLDGKRAKVKTTSLFSETPSFTDEKFAERLAALNTDSVEVDRDFEQRLERLSEPINDFQSFENKLASILPTDRNDAKLFFKRLTDDTQKKKSDLEIESEVLMVCKDAMETIASQTISSDQYRKDNETRDEKKEAARAGINSGIESFLERMEESQNQMRLRQLEQDEKIEKLLRLQEYTNRAARQTLGEEEWTIALRDLMAAGAYGAAKQLALAPFKMLKIIVFKPAFNSFWYFFGKGFYLIWGLLMLLLLLCVMIGFYGYLGDHAPGFISILYQSWVFLWGVAVRSGNSLAQALTPIVGEGWEIIWTSAKETSIEYLNWLYTWVYEALYNIFADVASSAADAVNPLKNWF